MSFFNSDHTKNSFDILKVSIQNDSSLTTCRNPPNGQSAENVTERQTLRQS